MNLSKQILLLEKLTGRKVIIEEVEPTYSIEEGEGQLSPEDLDMLKKLVDFALERLKVYELPVIELTVKRVEGTTTGGYIPDENLVLTYVKNRHVIDVGRSVVHELMHADQVQNDRLEVDDEDSAESPSEVEATVFAAKVMRDFAKENPQLYKESIKRNKKLLKESDNPDIEFGGTGEILSLYGLKEKYPNMIFTYDPAKGRFDSKGKQLYYVKVEIKTQDGKKKYLGGIKGWVTKSEAINYFNKVAKNNYDKYY